MLTNRICLGAGGMTVAGEVPLAEELIAHECLGSSIIANRVLWSREAGVQQTTNYLAWLTIRKREAFSMLFDCGSREKC